MRQYLVDPSQRTLRHWFRSICDPFQRRQVMTPRLPRGRRRFRNVGDDQEQLDFPLFDCRADRVGIATRRPYNGAAIPTAV